MNAGTFTNSAAAVPAVLSPSPTHAPEHRSDQIFGPTTGQILGQTSGQPPAPLMGIWRLGAALAIGDHASIWLAQPADGAGSTRWDYAVRCLAAGADRNAAADRLRRFARAAAAVQHPHLISVLDSSPQAAEPFLVMPRHEQRSLADLIATAARQPLPVTLWLVRQVAEAAAALHQAGWVHGDIRPQNVLLSSRGDATLIDLGCARQEGQAGDPLHRGSREFSAPEALRRGSPASAAADCFSLGRILWQLLALTDRRQVQPSGLDAAADSVAELVAELVDEFPGRRPTAAVAAQRLAQLEIETLGCQIHPLTATVSPQRLAA